MATNKFKSKIALILLLRKLKVSRQRYSLYEVSLPNVNLNPSGFLPGDYSDLDD